MTLTQEQRLQAKELVKSLPEEQKSDFIKRYKSLDSDEKRDKVLSNVINKLGGKNIEEQTKKELYPKDRFSNPIAEGLYSTVRDLQIPGYAFANQVLFNAPRALSEKMGYEYPQAETPVAGGLSNISGIAGGILGGGKVSGIGATSKILPAIAKTAIGGAVAGGLYTTPENLEDPSKRIMPALAGAIISPVAEIGSRFIGSTFKGVSDYFKQKELRNSLIKDRDQLEKFGINVSDKLREIDTNLSLMRLGRSHAKDQYMGQQKDVAVKIKDIENTLRNKSDELAKEVDFARNNFNVSKIKTIYDAKTKLRDMRANLSKFYADGVDDLVNKLDTPEYAISKDELSGILKSVVDNSTTATGKAEKEILSIIKSFAPKKSKAGDIKEIDLDEISDLTGEQVVKTIKNITKHIRSSRQSGEGLKDTDIVAEKFLDAMKDRIPGLKELNSSYAKAVNPYKKMAAIFKPFDETNTKQAENFIEKLYEIGSGKLSYGEKLSLSRALTGTDKVAGLGLDLKEVEGLANIVRDTVSKSKSIKSQLRSERRLAGEAYIPKTDEMKKLELKKVALTDIRKRIGTSKRKIGLDLSIMGEDEKMAIIGKIWNAFLVRGVTGKLLRMVK